MRIIRIMRLVGQVPEVLHQDRRDRVDSLGTIQSFTQKSDQCASCLREAFGELVFDDNVTYGVSFKVGELGAHLLMVFSHGYDPEVFVEFQPLRPGGIMIGIVVPHEFHASG